MRTLLIALITILASASALSQGTINFNNRVIGQVDAPVWAPVSNTGLGTLPDSHAQLYRVTGGAGSEVYNPVGQATTFRPPTAQNPLQSAYINPIFSMVIDGAAPGSSITVVMRAWQGASTYESAPIFGQSNPVTVNLGGDIPGAPPLVPANLVGLNMFALIPEPSTLSLGVLAAAALLSCRRK